MADATTVLSGTDFQRIMGAILDGPILADPFQGACRIGLRARQAGDDPDGFDLLTTVFEFANAIDSSHLRDVRKTHLVGSQLAHLEATPFDAPVAFIDRLILRGKKLPGGSDWLAFGGPPGCL